MSDHDDPRRDAAAGLRRSTTVSRRAAMLADAYAGLPQGVTRWRLAAALRAAARPLGLTGPMLRLLEHYIDLTYDQDWEAGAEPVVIRPLVEIAETLGRSERQVRNVERALAEAGLLAWRDSGNHQRRGRRDHITGRLVYAYGPTLAPLGARASELIALAQAARAETAETRRLRIAISALNRRIRADLTAAEASGAPVRDIAADFADMPGRLPAGVSSAALASCKAALAALAETLAGRLDAQDERLAVADSPTRAASRISPQAEISDGHHTDTFIKHAMNGCRAASVPDRSPPPLPVVLAAAGPEMRAAMRRTGGPPRWSTLVDAASLVAPLLGIDSALWGAACAQLGRNDAAISILVIERGASRSPAVRNLSEDPAIRQPPAYLRGMLARAASGTLRLDRSVRAWARRGAP